MAKDAELKGNCPRCNKGFLYKNGDDDLACTTCGHIIYQKLPEQAYTGLPKPETKPTKALSSDVGVAAKLVYFNKHRDEILADRLIIGNGRTLTKWGISVEAWALLKAEWRKEGVEIPDLRRGENKAEEKLPEPPTYPQPEDVRQSAQKSVKSVVKSPPKEPKKRSVQLVDARAAKLGRPEAGLHTKCVDCGVELYIRPHRLGTGKDYRCRSCANSVSAKLPRKPRGPYAKGKYLDEHRDEILADRLSLGHEATMRKWKIPSKSWQDTKRRWRKQGVEVRTMTRRAQIKEQAKAPLTPKMGRPRTGIDAKCADCGALLYIGRKRIKENKVYRCRPCITKGVADKKIIKPTTIDKKLIQEDSWLKITSELIADWEVNLKKMQDSITGIEDDIMYLEAEIQIAHQLIKDYKKKYPNNEVNVTE